MLCYVLELRLLKKSVFLLFTEAHTLWILSNAFHGWAACVTESHLAAERLQSALSKWTNHRLSSAFQAWCAAHAQAQQKALAMQRAIGAPCSVLVSILLWPIRIHSKMWKPARERHTTNNCLWQKR